MQRLSWSLALAVALTTGALVSTPLGGYLERSLFFEPAMTLRSRLGLRPHADGALRIVMLDDQSLKRIGRHPTYAEWRKIADRLFAAGFSKALLVDLFSLPSEVGSLASAAPQGELHASAVVSLEGSNKLTVDLKALDAGLLPAQGPVSRRFPPAEFAYVPAAAVRGDSGLLGDLNILDDATMVAAFAAPGGRLLPNLGLLAAPGLRVEDGGLRTDRGTVPVSEDGSLYVDFVDQASSYHLSLPVSAFFTGDGEHAAVRDALAPKALAKLAGGRVALLVPEGYTGSRFIDSPDGKVLSYAAAVAMANSALTGRYLYRPLPFAAVVVALAPLFVLLLGLRPARLALGAAAAVGLVVPVASFGLLCALGWVLPALQVLAVLAAATAVRAVYAVLATETEKALLRRDLEVGTLVQKLLLPKTPSGRIGGWEYRVVFKPHGYMAGDWFQVFASTPGEGEPVGVLAIGDVVGKGPSAALITALIAGIWNDWKKTWASGAIDVEAFVKALHRSIADTFKGEQNTTLSLAVLTEHEATLVSLAAPQWLHLAGATSKVEKIRLKRSNPIGYEADGEREPVVPLRRVAAAAGDALIAYTDGVMDGARAEAGFIRQLAELHPRLTEQDDLLAVSERVAREASAESVLHPDDFTLLLVRRIEPAGAMAAAPLQQTLRPA